MGEVVGFFLAFGLALGGSGTSDKQRRDVYMDAARHAFDGGYIQSGLKPIVDKRLKDIEKKYIPKEVVRYGSTTAIVVKVIVQQKLTLTWSF